MKTRNLDRIDQKIIALLQVTNRLSYAEMAERVGISASSCRRRVQALRQNGVIIADISVINSDVGGPKLTIFALVTLEREMPDWHAAFRRLMLRLPEVTRCHFVTGACDYLVQLSLSSMEEYDALIDRHFTADPVVKRVESLVVMKEVKTTGPAAAVLKD